MKGQSRKMSMLESFANIAIGYGVAVIAQIFILPLVGINDVRLSQQLMLANYMTIVSLVRSYSLRRVFNWLHAKNNG